MDHSQDPKPVAYRYKTKRSAESEGSVWHLIDHPGQRDALSASYGAVAQPLYTAPPSPQPLTDEQIERLHISIVEIMQHQFTNNRRAMTALQELIDAADAVVIAAGGAK